MTDLSYLSSGLFTTFFPETPAGADAWRVIAAGDGCGAVLTIHLPSVLAQLRKAGLSVGKAKPVMVSDDELLAELAALS